MSIEANINDRVAVAKNQRVNITTFPECMTVRISMFSTAEKAFYKAEATGSEYSVINQRAPFTDSISSPSRPCDC